MKRKRLYINLLKGEPIGDRSVYDFEECGENKYIELADYPELIPVIGHLSFERREEWEVFSDTTYEFLMERFENGEIDIDNMKNPKIITNKEIVVACKEIHGEIFPNEQFYIDDVENKFRCITDIEILKTHMDKYFSGDVEYSPETRNRIYGKQNDFHDNILRLLFKRLIINEFVPGESFVIYNSYYL